MAQDKTPIPAEEAPDLLTLEDENGQECTFEKVDETDVDGVHYLAVCPYEENQDAEPIIVLLRVGTDDQGEYMDIVEDDEELERISRVFEERLSDLYDIDDSELRS